MVNDIQFMEECFWVFSTENVSVIKDRECCHFNQEQFSRVCKSVKEANTGFDLGEQSEIVGFKSEFAVKPDAEILAGINNMNHRAIKYKYLKGTLDPG